MDEKACVVMCTVPNEAEGLRLAKGLVDARLAACVQLVPGLRSIYRWEGRVADEPELLLLIKTRGSRAADVEAFLASAHPYDTPEILALPVARGSDRYVAWLLEATTDPEGGAASAARADAAPSSDGHSG